MKSINAIIIQYSFLVSNGIKNLLHSKNINISNIYENIPRKSELNSIKNHLFFIDEKYCDFISAEQILLKKNKNIIIVIATSIDSIEFNFNYNEVIYLSDSFDTINKKIDKLIPKGNNEALEIENNFLSDREIDILKLVAKGKSNKEIADISFISIHTVITHRKNITKKLGIKSIAGLTLYAIVNNYIDS